LLFSKIKKENMRDNWSWIQAWFRSLVVMLRYIIASFTTGVIISLPKAIELQHASGQKGTMFPSMLSWPMLHTLNTKKLPELENIPVVGEFSNVFPGENPRMPLDWDI
jgi:hypothetical protein